MFAGGDQNYITGRAIKYLCGGAAYPDTGPKAFDLAKADKDCAKAVTAEIQDAFAALAGGTPKQLDNLEAYLKLRNDTAYMTCFISSGAGDSGVNRTTGTLLNKCMDEFYKGKDSSGTDKKVNLYKTNVGGDLHFKVMGEYVPWAVEQVKAGIPAASTIPLPAAFMTYLDSIKDPKYLVLYRTILRLYSEAKAELTSEQQLDSRIATRIADQLVEWARLRKDLLDHATTDTDKYNVEAAIVTSLVEGVDAAHDFAVKIVDLIATDLFKPEKIGYKQGEKIALEALEELRQRSYEVKTDAANKEAVGRDFGRLTSETAKTTSNFVSKLHPSMEKLAGKLHKYAASVKLNEDKTIKEVVFKKRGASEVPSKLVDAFGAKNDPLLTAVLAELLKQLMDAAAGALGGKDKARDREAELMEQLIDKLNRLSTANGGDVSPEFFARIWIFGVDPDGKIHTGLVPDELFSPKIMRLINGPGGIAILHALKRLFIEAILEDPKRYMGQGAAEEGNRSALAKQISGAARKKIYGGEDLESGVRDFLEDQHFVELKTTKGKKGKPDVVEAVIAAPPHSANEICADKKCRTTLTVGLDSEFGGVTPTEKAETNPFQALVIAGVKGRVRLNDEIGITADAQYIYGKWVETFAKAGINDGFQLDPNNAGEISAFRELSVGINGHHDFEDEDGKVTGKIKGSVKGGLTSKRVPALGAMDLLPDVGMAYMLYPTAGSSATAGGIGHVEGSYNTSEDGKLIIGAAVGFNTFRYNVSLRQDADAPPTPDGPGGCVVSPSLYAGYQGKRVHAGVAYRGNMTVGGDYSPDIPLRNVTDGISRHTGEAGAKIFFGGEESQDHSLLLHARYNALLSNHATSLSQVMATLQYEGVWFNRTRWMIQGVANLSYMRTFGNVDPSLPGSTLSGAGGAGDISQTNISGDVSVFNEAFVATLKPKVILRQGPQYSSGIYLQPIAQLICADQGHDGNGMSCAFFGGAAFGFLGDLIDLFKKGN
ncbi:MAG: hypothetical protein V2A66_10595 [Pseudomonadota bacterium]